MSDPPKPAPAATRVHHEATVAVVPADGSLDGRYTFRRVFPGRLSQAFRQTFDLVIEHGRATLHITTTRDRVARTNADLDQASFSIPVNSFDGAGTATLDLASGELVLELSGGTRWTCQRLEVQVAPRNARLTRPESDDACTTDSPVEPSTTTAVRTLSCRANGYSDGPPPFRGDASRERRRDSDRWTFTPAPGLELLGDACPARTGILRITSRGS